MLAVILYAIFMPGGLLGLAAIFWAASVVFMLLVVPGIAAVRWLRHRN